MKVLIICFLALLVVSANGVLKFPRLFDAPQSKNGFAGAEKAITEQMRSFCSKELLHLDLCGLRTRTGMGIAAWRNKTN
ncbi:hypothetical protein QR680_010460 [Steinernema hermaphroditum]|uniref:Uncharacterized protein n=1 Tax=Steinernema hermaphroditum TaxID=289476 RepID=A0AA39MBU6_9BILA|nr:hypothetical protein QR680_010460 [Steinernema hermaphroditum]